MEFLYLKSIHIIFVITWFAGLFYLPRLMVYSAEANEMNDQVAKNILLAQYQLMKKRLLYGITWPSAVITFALGMRMLMIYPLTDWLKLKLVFVLALFFYHFSLQVIYKQQGSGNYRYNGQQLRAWNEVPTVLLFAIVFLVVLKNTVDFWWGLAGLAALVILLMSAIRIYKIIRKKNTR
ncbi:MAG: CopD family protein [Chitinophagaceae bacterium]